jgi:hypothetical protein
MFKVITKNKEYILDSEIDSKLINRLRKTQSNLELTKYEDVFQMILDNKLEIKEFDEKEINHLYNGLKYFKSTDLRKTFYKLIYKNIFQKEYLNYVIKIKEFFKRYSKRKGKFHCKHNYNHHNYSQHSYSHHNYNHHNYSQHNYKWSYTEHEEHQFITEDFIEKLLIPNVEINWNSLCLYFKFSEDFVEKYENKIRHECLTNFCSNRNISKQIYENDLHVLNWNTICRNTGLNDSFFEENMDYIDSDVEEDNQEDFKNDEDFNSELESLTMEDFQKDERWKELSANNNLSESFFRKYRHKIWESEIATNDNLSEKFFLEIFPDIKKYVSDLSGNQNISESFFEKYINYVDWEKLSRIAKESFLEKYINRVNWFSVCQNENITESFLEKYIHKINWNSLCRNESISESFFEKYMNKVNLTILCENEGISESFFERHIDKLSEIDWKKLCYNNNISIDFFEKYVSLNKIDWYWLSQNNFKIKENVLKIIEITNYFSFDRKWKKLI